MHDGRVSWSGLEALLQARPGWRRRGREWHGPCPLTGHGTDTAWFAAGAVDAIRGGCRQCGGRLDARPLAEHLQAVGALTLGAAVPLRRTPRPRRPARPSAPALSLALGPLPAAVWRASSARIPFTHLRYLRRRLGGVPALPAGLRWLSRSAAAGVPADPEGRRVVVPAGADGALGFLFAAPGDTRPGAVQLEALSGHDRVPWGRGGVKRWSVPGSRFDDGRRVFVAVTGRPGAGAWVCEGPMDALALALRERASVPFLEGAAVIGVAGVGGLRPAAVAGVAGPVVLALQGDGPGVGAGRALGRRLRAAGRSVRVAPAGAGEDWAESVALELGGG